MNLSDDQIRKIFSGIYADACLDEKINMRDFVSNFESIREQVTAGSGTSCWNLIKLNKDFFYHQPNLNFLLRLQQLYYAELNKKISKDIEALIATEPGQAWQTWLREYADAVINWCSIVYEPLCNTQFSFDEDTQKRIESFKKLNKYILYEKWVNTFPFFEALTKENCLSNYQLSCFNVIAGQVILYWMPAMHKCVPYFETAKTLSPENSKAVRAMGEYHLRRQDYEKARNAFLSSLSLQPNDTENYIYMADSYKDERKLETAEQWYKDAININLLATGSLGSLVQLYGQPEWHEEKKIYIDELLGQAERIETNMPFENGLYNRYRDAGHAYFAIPDYATAKKYYEKAYKLRPELTAAKLDLGYTCGYMKDFENADKWLSLSLSTTNEAFNFDTYWAYAWLYEQANADKSTEENRQKAIGYYEKCGALRNELQDVINNAIGLLYYNSGEYKKAIEYYIKAMELNPGETVYTDNYNNALAKLTDFSEFDIQSTNPDILNDTGNFFYRSNEFDRAKQYYKRAIDEKQEAVYFENLGLANEKLSLFEEAVAAYLKSAESDTKTGSAFNRLGVFYYNQMQDEKAIAFYKKALEKEPANELYLQNLAYAYESSQQYDAAIEVYNKMLAADATNDNVLYRLALIAVYNKNNEEALGYITQALKHQPGNLAYLKTAGTIYENLSRDDEALEMYNKALAVNEADEYFNNRAGIIYYRKRTDDAFKKSIDHYNKAIEANEAATAGTRETVNVIGAVYWQNLALAYADSGEYDAAEKAYLHSLKLDPETAENYNNIGSFYFNKKSDWNNALQMFKQAFEKNPNDSLYCRNLAAAYAQTEDFENADALYAKADELDKKALEQHPQT